MIRHPALLAALAAATTIVIPATPAGAHSGCGTVAAEPRHVVRTGGEEAIMADGRIACSGLHDPASYLIDVCLHYSPVFPPEESHAALREVPPTARVLVCDTETTSSDWGSRQLAFQPCPYLPGYYRTAVSGASAGAPGEHPELAGIDDRSEWVFFDGTACL